MMALPPSFTCFVALLFAAPSCAFVAPSHFGIAKARTSTPLFAQDLPHTIDTLVHVGEFQLEEREDQDSELTQIFLNPDRTVTLGKTDGPPVKEYSGSWSILETAGEKDQPFRLRLDRTYEAGTHTGSKDLGEFDYHVKREFWGNMGMVGESVSVQGDMHGLDESANVDCQVGYFSLIDATAENQVGSANLAASV